MKGSGVKLCAFPAAEPCRWRGVGLLFLGRVGRSSGLEEHPDGTRGISSSARGGGEAARRAAGEEGEEVPAQLCTVLCGTGQLLAQLWDRRRRGSRKCEGGRALPNTAGASLCSFAFPGGTQSFQFVSAPVASVLQCEHKVLLPSSSSSGRASAATDI